MIKKKKIKLLVMSWSTHSINNISICKKFWHSTSTQHTPTCERNTHDVTLQQHTLQQHDALTTQGPLTTLHNKCKHVNSDQPTTACTKNFMTKSYTSSGRNNLYIMTSSMCNTPRQTFFHMLDEADLRHETQSFPRHCAKHITPGTNQRRCVSPTTKKQKWLTIN
jgi:hypothetical protein